MTKYETQDPRITPDEVAGLLNDSTETRVRMNPDDDREMQVAIVHPGVCAESGKVSVFTIKHGASGGKVGQWASGILKRAQKRAVKAASK
jgi:hypothetical protein